VILELKQKGGLSTHSKQQHQCRSQGGSYSPALRAATNVVLQRSCSASVRMASVSPFTPEQAMRLLDFGNKMDMSLLDSVVSCFYNTVGPQVRQRTPHPYPTQLHIWTLYNNMCIYGIVVHQTQTYYTHKHTCTNSLSHTHALERDHLHSTSNKWPSRC
jgi:hypothetical protein